MKQLELDFIINNPGFEKSRMYGHLYRNLTSKETMKVEWLRRKQQLEARKYITGKLKEYKNQGDNKCRG